MKNATRRFSLAVAVLGMIVGMAFRAEAGFVNFSLQGKAGPGLLSGNENATITGPTGSGGIVGTGIVLDTTTDILSIDVAWGSGNGFTDMSGVVVSGHLHGPTADPGTAAFTENAAVKYPLTALAGFNSSATNGGFNGSITILPGDVAGLMAGNFYLNFHTAANPGGEIRGYLEPTLTSVPEPSTIVLTGTATMMGLVLSLRRKRALNA